MKFTLGRTVATPGALEAITEAGQTPDYFLDRHVQGDWGHVCKDDRRANDEALVEEGRILSAYKTLKGVTIWAITEWDRSCTTLLLPEEY